MTAAYEESVKCQTKKMTGKEPDFEVEFLPFSEFFNGKEAKQMALVRFGCLVSGAKNGDMFEFNEYFSDFGNAPNIEEDKAGLLLAMIKDPQSFKSPKAIFEGLTDQQIDFQKFIADNVQMIGDGIWGMHGRSPRQEVAEIGAVMAAEYLRYKISRDDKFLPDFTSVFQTEFTTGQKLTRIMDRKIFKDSIIAIQHELVNAVKKDQDKYPLNRGIPFLGIIADDLPSKVTNIWTKKLQGVKIATQFNMMVSDVVSAKPVFAP